jgi:hypothetical protein
MSKTKDIERREKMPELNEANFELIDKNKAEQFERQKIKFLEDRIKVLEKAIESHAKILARFQMTEDKKELAELDDIEIYESVGGGFDFDEEKKS